MELLIKVGSNTDDRVQCMNPQCKNMFRDPNRRRNKCPECQFQYLDRHQDNCWQDGDIVVARSDGWAWSESEKPNVVRITSDAISTLLQVLNSENEQELLSELRESEMEKVEIDGKVRHIIKKRRRFRINVSPVSGTQEFKVITASNVQGMSGVIIGN